MRPKYDFDKIKFATDGSVQVLKEYAKLAPACAKAFQELSGRETCFGWEEPLLEFIEN